MSEIKFTDFFKIEGLESSNAPVQIYFYKEIGFEDLEKEKICSEEFCKQIDAIPKERQIVLRMNSCGGSFLDGLAIAHKIAERGNVVCHIDGNCASAASVVAAACDRVIASEGASITIHNARGNVFNKTSEDIRNLADMMDETSNKMAAVYCRKTGKSIEAIKAIMVKGDRMTAQKALSLGLVDEIKILNTAVQHARIESCETVDNTEKEKNIMKENETKPEVTAQTPNSGANAQNDRTAELLARTAEAETKAKELEAKAKAAEEKMQAMRKERITAIVNTACSEGRIANTDVDGWIEACVDSDKMMERLNKLPVLNTPPATGRNASEEREKAEFGDDTLADITAHNKELNGWQKINYLTEHEATIRAALVAESPSALEAKGKGYEIGADITVDSNLKLDYIHTKMLWAFNRKNGNIDKICTTRFDATPMRQGTNKIQFQIMPLATETVRTFDGTYATSGDHADSNREVTINTRKYVVLSYTSAQICEQPLLRVEEHLLRNVEKLSDQIYDDVLALVTPANFATLSALVNELKVANTVFDYTHVAKIQEALDSADWPKARRNLILNSKYNLGLMLNSGRALLDSSATGKESPLVTGKIFAPFGFDYYESGAHIPANSCHLYGFACVGDAILMASAPIVPTDKARKIIEFQVMQSPNGGIPIMFRDWFSPESDKYVDIVEANYGLAVGDSAALVPFVSE